MKNLKEALYHKNITDKAVAEMLGVTEKTLRNKMQGVTEFTWTEIQKIKLLFPEYEFTYLFANSGEAIA